MGDLEEGEIEEVEDGELPFPREEMRQMPPNSPLSSHIGGGGGERHAGSNVSLYKGRSPLQNSMHHSRPTALEAAERYAKFHRRKRSRSPPDPSRDRDKYANDRYNRQDGGGRNYDERSRPYFTERQQQQQQQPQQKFYDSSNQKPRSHNSNMNNSLNNQRPQPQQTTTMGGDDNFDDMLTEYRKIQDNIDMLNQYQQLQDELKNVGERKQLLMEESKRGPSGSATPERATDSPRSVQSIALDRPVVAPEPPIEIVQGSFTNSFRPLANSGDMPPKKPMTKLPSAKNVIEVSKNVIQVLESARKLADGSDDDDDDDDDDEDEDDDDEEDETVEELQLRMMALQSAARRNPESQLNDAESAVQDEQDDIELNEVDEGEEGEVVEEMKNDEGGGNDNDNNEDDDDVIELKDDEDDDVIIESVKMRDYRDVDFRRNRWKEYRGGGRYQDPVFQKTEKSGERFSAFNSSSLASLRGGSRDRANRSPTPTNIRQGLSALRNRESSNQQHSQHPQRRPSTPRDNYDRIAMELGGSSDDEMDGRPYSHSRHRPRFPFETINGAPQMPPMPEMFLPLRDSNNAQQQIQQQLTNSSPRPPPPLPSKPQTPPPPPPRETPPRLMDIPIPTPRLAPSPPAAPDLNFRSYMPPRQAPPPPSFSMSLMNQNGVSEIPLPPLLAPSPPKMPAMPRSAMTLTATSASALPPSSPSPNSPTYPRDTDSNNSSMPIIAPSPPHVIEDDDAFPADTRGSDEGNMSDISEEDPWELLERCEKLKASIQEVEEEVQLEEEGQGVNDPSTNEANANDVMIENTGSLETDSTQDKENQERNEKEWQALSKVIEKSSEQPFRVRRLSKKRTSLQKEAGEEVDDEEEDEDDQALRAQLLAAMAMKKKDSPAPSPLRPEVTGRDVEGVEKGPVTGSKENTEIPGPFAAVDSSVVAGKMEGRVKKRKVVKKKRPAKAKVAKLTADSTPSTSAVMASEVVEATVSPTPAPIASIPSIPVLPSTSTTALSQEQQPPQLPQQQQQQQRRVQQPKAPQFPRVAPVIINIGKDSSDEDEEGGEIAESSNAKSDPLASNIDSFLKEMRGQAQVAKKEQNIVDMLHPEKAMEYLKLKEELSRRAASSAKVALKTVESSTASAAETPVSSPPPPAQLLQKAAEDGDAPPPQPASSPSVTTESPKRAVKPTKSAADLEKIKTLEKMFHSNRQAIQVLSTDIFKHKTNMDRKILNLSKNEEKIKKMKEQIKTMEKSSEKMNAEVESMKERMTSDHERLSKQKSLEESIKKKLKILGVEIEPQMPGTPKRMGAASSPAKRSLSVDDFRSMDSSQVELEKARLQQIEREMAARIAQHQREMSIRRSLEHYPFMHKQSETKEKQSDRAAESTTRETKRRSLMELSSSGIKPHIKESDEVFDGQQGSKMVDVNSQLLELPSDEKLSQLRQIQLEREKKFPSVMRDATLLAGTGTDSFENLSQDGILTALNFEMIFPAGSGKDCADVPPFLLGSDATLANQTEDQTSSDQPPAEKGAVVQALGNDDKSLREVDDKTKPYESPLMSLKSLRLMPKFRLKYNLKLSSPSFSYKFSTAPSSFCHFDLTGTCNDDACRSIHQSDVPMLSNQLVMDLSAYAGERMVLPKDTALAKLTDSEAMLLLGNFAKDFMKRNSYKDVSSEDLCILISSNVNDALMKENLKPSEMLIRHRSSPWKPNWNMEKFDSSSSNDQQPEDDEGDATWKRWKMPRKEKDYDEAINLQNPMGGDSCYGEGLVLPGMKEDIETAVMENPGDVELWLKLATLNMKVGDTVDECYESSLNVMARGLEMNRDSFDLWFRYLSLFEKYKRHKEEPANDELIGLLKQAVLLAPAFKFFHWRFTLEKTFNGKMEALNEGLRFLTLSSPESSGASPSASLSHQVFTLIVNRIALLHSCQLLARIAKTFDLILNDNSGKNEGSIIEDERDLLSPLRFLLTIQDLSALHLVFVYTSVMKGQLPQCIFDPHQGPFGAVVRKNAMYLIAFEVASVPNVRYWNNVGNRLFSAIQRVTESYDDLLAKEGGALKAMEGDFYHPVASLVYNYIQWASLLPKSAANQLTLVSLFSVQREKAQTSEKTLNQVKSNVERLSTFVSSSPSLKSNVQIWKIIFDVESHLIQLTSDEAQQREYFDKEQSACSAQWPLEPFSYYSIATKSKSKAIIEKYVKSQFKLDDCQLVIDPEDERYDYFIRILFEKVLGLLPEDENGELEPLRPQLPPPDVAFLNFLSEKPQRRVYFWLCYVEWLRLSDSTSSSSSTSSSLNDQTISRVVAAFEQSLSLCPTNFDDNFDDAFMLGRPPRQVLWRAYLNFLSSTLVASSSSTLLPVVDVESFVGAFKKCLNTTTMTRPGDGHVMLASPDVKMKFGDFKDKWEDYSFHNGVIDSFLRHCDDRVWPLLLFRLVQTYPNNAYLLLRLASYFFSKSFDEEKTSLKAETLTPLVNETVKQVVHLICLWKILISRALRDGRVDSARALYRKCLEINPCNSSMWKDWLLFELGHLRSRDDEVKVMEISKLSNDCLASCNLDLRTYLREMCGKGKKTRWAFVL